MYVWKIILYEIKAYKKFESSFKPENLFINPRLEIKQF